MSLWRRLIGKKANSQLADDLLNQTADEIDNMAPTNIIVAGKTGSGKSTLINGLFRENIAVTGVGQPVTQHLEKLTKEGVPLTLYDTKGLELSVDAQREVLSDLSKIIQENKNDPQDEIHVVYYTLNATMNRIEPYEIELIEALAQQVPVILVLTQSISSQSHEFEDYLKELDLPVRGIYPILAQDYLLQGDQIVEAYGLQTLVDATMEIIPSEAHRAFINAQQIDIDRKVQSARSWANRYVGTAFGVGFTPIPVADATVLIPMQITMLAHLTAIFGVSMNKSQILSILAGIGGTGTATIAGRYIVSNILKLVPGVGSTLGGTISGATASTVTLALAYSYIEVMKYVTQAEKEGKDAPIRELQRIMNQNFSGQFKTLNKYLPEEVKETTIGKWLHRFSKN